MEVLALFCELGGEAADCVRACFFYGRHALADRVHRARSLSFEGGAFLIHQFDLTVEVPQAP